MSTSVAATEARVAPLRCANLEIRPSGQLAFADRRPIDLTSREFQLLLVLAERRNVVVARGELYALVWGQRMPHRDRSVDVFVRRVRCKLQKASPGWAYIHTHVGVGYRFAPTRRD